MALLINIPGRPLDKLITKLQASIPTEEIVIWPDNPANKVIDFALVWKHQPGSLTPYTQLKGISSFGAGVDSILKDPHLPNLPIARIVDPDLATNMAQYVLTMIQHHRLRLPQFTTQQQIQLWKPKSPRRQKRVGILGLGQLGSVTAKLLTEQGYEVSGWSQSAKSLPNIICYAGQQGLTELLANADYLVCLLPLTDQTQDLLNAKTLAQLPKGAVVINVARGEHLVDDDLVSMLDSGHIDYAYLDVFRREPLETSHPFWRHPNIQITPHVSAVTNVDTAVTQIIENYQRIKTNSPLLNTIDRTKGY